MSAFKNSFNDKPHLLLCRKYPLRAQKLVDINLLCNLQAILKKFIAEPDLLIQRGTINISHKLMNFLHAGYFPDYRAAVLRLRNLHNALQRRRLADKKSFVVHYVLVVMHGSQREVSGVYVQALRRILANFLLGIAGLNYRQTAVIDFNDRNVVREVAIPAFR